MSYMEVYPIISVAKGEVLVSKDPSHEMLCALLRQKADRPLCPVTDEIHASCLGQYAILIGIQTRIAEELETFAAFQLEAVVVQPGRIVPVASAEYLVDNSRLLILVAEGKQIPMTAINFQV